MPLPPAAPTLLAHQVPRRLSAKIDDGFPFFLQPSFFRVLLLACVLPPEPLGGKTAPSPRRRSPSRASFFPASPSSENECSEAFRHERRLHFGLRVSPLPKDSSYSPRQDCFAGSPQMDPLPLRSCFHGPNCDPLVRETSFSQTLRRVLPRGICV